MNLDDYIKEQQEDKAKGLNVLRAERDSFRINLLDQFAIAALSMRSHDSSWQPYAMAKDAYLLADAMLAEKKRREGL